MSTTRLSGSRADLRTCGGSGRQPARDPQVAPGDRLTAENLRRLAHILDEAARVVADHPDRDAVAAVEAVARRSRTGRIEMALDILAHELPDDGADR